VKASSEAAAERRRRTGPANRWETAGREERARREESMVPTLEGSMEGRVLKRTKCSIAEEIDMAAAAAEATVDGRREAGPARTGWGLTRKSWGLNLTEWRGLKEESMF
jgi:hypothetical protein